MVLDYFDFLDAYYLKAGRGGRSEIEQNLSYLPGPISHYSPVTAHKIQSPAELYEKNLNSSTCGKRVAIGFISNSESQNIDRKDFTSTDIKRKAANISPSMKQNHRSNLEGSLTGSRLLSFAGLKLRASSNFIGQQNPAQGPEIEHRSAYKISAGADNQRQDRERDVSMQNKVRNDPERVDLKGNKSYNKETTMGEQILDKVRDSYLKKSNGKKTEISDHPEYSVQPEFKPGLGRRKSGGIEGSSNLSKNIQPRPGSSFSKPYVQKHALNLLKDHLKDTNKDRPHQLNSDYKYNPLDSNERRTTSALFGLNTKNNFPPSSKKYDSLLRVVKDQTSSKFIPSTFQYKQVNPGNPARNSSSNQYELVRQQVYSSHGLHKQYSKIEKERKRPQIPSTSLTEDFIIPRPNIGNTGFRWSKI